MPDGMLDLHLHLSLTDPHGACGEAACRELLLAAQASNVSTLLITPHTDTYKPAADWQADHAATVSFCQRQAPHIAILSGSEFLIRHLEDVLLVQRGLVPTLNQTKAVLIEFLPDARSSLMLDAAHELRVLGYIPIVAHPERYETFQRSPEKARDLVASGAILQGTLSSVIGVHGSRVRQTLWTLLKSDLIACMASDFHGGDYAAHIQQGLAPLAKQLGQPAVQRLMSDAPARILAGQRP